MILRDYEWFYKCNCSVSFNHKENVTTKTHLLKSGWSLKTNLIAECNHPYQLLEGGRGEKPRVSQKISSFAPPKLLALHFHYHLGMGKTQAELSHFDDYIFY